MRVAQNDSDDRARLRGFVQFNKYTYIQCEWHRMTRMTGPDCAVMCNLINIHTCIHTCFHTYIQTYIHIYIHTYYIHTYIHT